MTDILNPRSTFEGQPVGGRKVRLTGTTAFEETLSVDQAKRLVVDVTVTGVAHVVDAKTDTLQRVHTLKVEAVEDYTGADDYAGVLDD
jgi:hypothetical protein